MVPVPVRLAAAATVPNIVSLLPETIVMLPPVVFSAAVLVRLPAAPISSVWLLLVSAIALAVVAVLEISSVNALAEL
jgi:hypothetical protein